MRESSAIKIEAMTPLRLQDFLRFFDHDAFRDNPEWAACYCFFPHASQEPGQWDDTDGEHNRAASAAMVAVGTTRGYLAYDGDLPVGWCNSNLRFSYTILEPGERDPQQTGAIVCFVVAKPYRGRGVARRLLNAACEGFRGQGIRTVEGFPRKEAESEASNHYGPLSMYLSAGFQQVGEQGANLIMRKQVG